MKIKPDKFFWGAVLGVVLCTIAATVTRRQPMPVLFDDGHGFTVTITTNGFVTQRGMAAPVTNAFGGSAGQSFISYTAYLAQDSTTNPPVATVFENSLGADVVWTRTGVGHYLANVTNSIFSLANTFISGATDFEQSAGYFFEPGFVDSDTLSVYCRSVNGAAVEGLFGWVEIRVYP